MDRIVYNIRFAFRILRRSYFYAIISVIGLSAGMVACSFIMLWIQDEKSYDRFHKDADEIYTIVTHFTDAKILETTETSPGLSASAAKDNFVEVKDYCRIRSFTAGYIIADGVKTNEKKVIVADSGFFSFFNFPFVSNYFLKSLDKPNEIVISERLAKELFGSDDPIGKMIRMNGRSENYEDIEKSFSIAAVMKDLPANTSLPRADLVIPNNSDPYVIYTPYLNDWGSCEFHSFVRIKKNTDIEQLAKKITNLQTRGRDTRYFTLQPLVDLHLYSLDGAPKGIKTVWLFSWIALAIIVVSCINYVNLETGRSMKRNHEVAVKKIFGAQKTTLFLQMMTEAIILFLIALGITILLNISLVGVFNHLSGKEIDLEWNNGNSWLLYGLMFLTVIVFAGIYPALSISSFKLLNMQQWKMTITRKNLLLKALIIFQFIISITLIAATVTLESQLSYIRRIDLGYNTEYVFTFKTRDMAEHYQVVKAELMRIPWIVSVDGASAVLSDIGSSNITRNWEGKTGDGMITYCGLDVDSTFFNHLEMAFTEGSGFQPGVRVNMGEGFGLDENHQFVINETMAKRMGLTKPFVGKWMEADWSRGQIVGVVKDFHFNSFYQEIEPLVIFYMPNWAETLYIRSTKQDVDKAIAAVKKMWEQYNPNYTFDYRFLDESFERLYSSYIKTGLLFRVFSLIAILISCLGLFGLVTHNAAMRRKETGIRKLFGASILNIVTMLTKEYILLVCISIVIAFPLAYKLLDSLLQEFAYRISIGWWIFIVSGAITIILTLITVAWKAIDAATTNPSDAISN